MTKKLKESIAAQKINNFAPLKKRNGLQLEFWEQQVLSVLNQTLKSGLSPFGEKNTITTMASLSERTNAVW